MIDINDNDFKLLKMNESLLNRLSSSDGDIYYQTLKKYEKLAKKIEKVNYDELMVKINNYIENKHNLSLEEELNLLEKLENEYRQLEELQFKFRKISSDLDLSNLIYINIDNIINRKNLISGYLINLKNIDSIHETLESSNRELIIANKQRETVERKYQTLEDELKRNFVNAEGRLLTAIQTLKNTSVKDEYLNVDIDLLDLISNSDKTLKKLEEINNIKREKDELLKTGEICYENIPTQENQEILSSLRKEAISANYQLCLIKIVKLILEKVNTFDKMLEKREKIKDLIKRRLIYLEQQNIKFSIDPFTRIKLEEQINYIIQLGDNSKEINRIKKNINELDLTLESLNNKKDEFLTDLNENFTIIEDKIKIKDIDISNVNVEKRTFEDIIVLDEFEQPIFYEKNQVVHIKDVNSNFRISRVKEKSSSVIRRVNEIFNEKDNERLLIEKSPELVIDSVIKPEEEKQIFEMADIIQTKDKNQEGHMDIFEIPMQELSETSIFEDKLKDNDRLFEITPEQSEEPIEKLEDKSEDFTNLFEIPVQETTEPLIFEDILSSNDNSETIQDESEELKGIIKDEPKEFTDLFQKTVGEIPEPLESTQEITNKLEGFSNLIETSIQELPETSIFENNQNNPFNGIALFNDKLEDELPQDEEKEYYLNKELESILSDSENEMSISYEETDDVVEEDAKDKSLDEMPEAFWETISEEKNNETDLEEQEPSFEEQIKKLKLTA